MRWPRPKFKLWMPMVVIVFVALGLGLYQRSIRLERISLKYSGVAGRLEMGLIGPSGTSKDGPSGREVEEILDKVHWNDAVAHQYRIAARQPWNLFDPDPKQISCTCGHHDR